MGRRSASSEPARREQVSLADRPVGDLLDQVAARRPAPGGGTSAALTSALAAGLVQMTARFAAGGDGAVAAGDGAATADDRLAAVQERAGALRGEALQLAERELHSYAPVLEAMRLDAATPGRDDRVAQALSDAAQAPLAIARGAAEVAELGVESLRAGNSHLRGDAITGILLAEAACRSAGHLVELNLATQAADPRRSEVAKLAKRGDAARRQALHGH